MDFKLIDNVLCTRSAKKRFSLNVKDLIFFNSVYILVFQELNERFYFLY